MTGQQALFTAYGAELVECWVWVDRSGMSRFLPLLLLASTVFVLSTAASATVTERDTEFTLQGEGTFRWTLIRVFDARFYLGADTPAEADPLGNVPKRLELKYAVSISAADFIASGDKALRANLSDEQLASIQDEIDAINQAYRDVSSGDRYTLTYIPGEGTTLALNDEVLTRIDSTEFGQYYFHIWLGAEPVNERLRNRLLGR